MAFPPDFFGTSSFTTSPADSDPVKDGASKIRETRSVITNFLAVLFNTTTGKLNDYDEDTDTGVLGSNIQNSSSDNTKRAIGSDHLQTSSVTTAKLADYSVTSTKVACDAARYFLDAGSANAISITVADPNITSPPATGTTIAVKIAAANTGATTLTINSGTARNVKKNFNQALTPLDLQVGQIVQFSFDGTNWQLLGSPAGKCVVFQHQETSGTGGGTASTGAWTKHKLTTKVYDEGIGASVSSDVVTLPPGRYRFRGDCAMVGTGSFRLRLQNTSSSSTVGLGNSGGSSNTSTPDFSVATVAGQFTITSSTTFELQYWASAAWGTGTPSQSLGRPVSTGDAEVYATLEFFAY